MTISAQRTAYKELEKPLNADRSQQFLLTTKLHVPRTHTHLVPRPQLHTRLDEGCASKLTLVTAPAGSGKTTLLSAWVGHSDRPYCWVSLDKADNELLRFLSYMIAALQHVHPHVGENTLALLHSPEPVPVEVVLSPLLNDISTLSAPFILVLDEYHLITASIIHTALAFLLDHLPPQLQLIIASRTDPPLPLARWRAAHLLTELHEQDLRFTHMETAKLFSHIVDHHLTDDDIALLTRRTQGWVTGLQLAALSLREHTNPLAMIQAFAGSHRHVVDYLTEEVFEQQPVDVQYFLLATSILDRLHGPLCDALLNEVEIGNRSQCDGYSVLETLERNHLFVDPLDDERQWYRYHPLFAQFLYDRLTRLHPDWLPRLHRCAGDWYASYGLLDSAVEHRLVIKEYDHAATLMEHMLPTLLMHGEIGTILRWIEQLPETLVRRRLRLALARCWGLFFQGDLRRVTLHLQEIAQILTHLTTQQQEEAGFTQTDIYQMQGEVATIAATTALVNEALPTAIEQASLALERLPESNGFARCIAAITLGYASRLHGDISAATHSFARALAYGQTIGNTVITILASHYLAQLQVEQGQLNLAIRTYSHLFQLVNEGKGQQLPVTGLAYIGMGHILRERNDLEAATHLVEEGLRIGTSTGAVEVMLFGFLALALINYARDDIIGAHEALQMAESIAPRVQTRWLRTIEEAQTFDLLLKLGEHAKVIQSLKQQGISTELALHAPLEKQFIIARTYLLQERWGEAFALLDQLREIYTSRQITGRLLAILVQQTLCLQRQGKTTQAISVLAQALTLAEPENYIRIFIDEGVTMASLLRRLASEGICTRYVHTLLTALQKHTEVLSVVQMSDLLPEPSSFLLGKRELEVLQLIASGCSNQEIARRLVISIGTVKTHVNNLFRKLDVENRTQAVARAKELKIL